MNRFWQKAKIGQRRHSGVRLGVERLESRNLLSIATINWATVNQTIAGFGASSAWDETNWTASEQQLLYSTTNGGGLSMLRSRIEPNTSATSGEIQMMQLAQAMGVTIFSTPWSPPAQYKSNDDTSNGGYLLPAYYQTYANELAQYVINMRNQNPSITVSAVSLQNEPDYTASYESCTYTAAQLAAFLPYVYNAFAAAGLTTKIILPEETGWHWELASTIMGSPTLSAEVGIYADHDYDGGSGPIPVTLNSGQQVWETEIYDSSGTNTDITSGIWTATNIYNMLITSRANAWNYWWIYSSGSGGLLGQDWQTTKALLGRGQLQQVRPPGLGGCRRKR